ncbi:MAG TPA: Fis family transcriptional regulator [Bacteroides sp.]|nr:Fis family transcriptional regulator [Bacteroides sp.]
MSEKKISHDGVVDSTEGNDVVVRITSYAACNGCHARGACNVTEEKEKYMRIKAIGRFDPGEKVRVVLAQSLGFRALFLGYILPFLLVLTALLIASATGVSELVAGLISLSVLLPYYIGLKLFRGKLDRQFSFFLHKIS